jgi:hypothetical protein
MNMKLAPIRAAAPAVTAAAWSFRRVAPGSSASAPSTSVHAAQLMTASGRWAASAASTARASVMSSSRRESPTARCP